MIIIDDDQQFADLLSEIAKTAGFHSDVCLDAREYFAAPREAMLMVLDLNMPCMDGIEVLRQLSVLRFSAPIILVSGYDSGVLHSAQKLAEEHHLNVIGSLTKPLAIVDFMQMIQSVRPSAMVAKQVKAEQQPITAEELLQAINNQEIVLFFQPQIDLISGALTGVEALARWQSPSRGLVSPADFIPLAERQGLMGEMTSAIIQQAVTQSNKWKKKGLDIPISVNVSAENITSLSLPEQLTDLMSMNGLKPESIVLEITESALMGELATSLDILTRLRMKGFELSIDDFGTGSSSLVLLHRVPFTELKIDMSFVKNMVADVDAFAIVETCVMLAHKLHMRVVAEGVENQHILDALKSMQCDIGQGYHIGKPMPAEQFMAWHHRNYSVTT